MKKQIISSLVLGIMLIMSGFAQTSTTPTPQCPPGFTCVDTAPTEIPIASLSMLKAYAKTKVAIIGGAVWGRSVSGTNSFRVDYPFADADADHMAAVAAAQPLKFTAVRDDQMQSYLYYDGKFGTQTYELFWGWKEFQLIQGIEDTVPDDARDIELEVSDWVPHSPYPA